MSEATEFVKNKLGKKTLAAQLKPKKKDDLVITVARKDTLKTNAGRKKWWENKEGAKGEDHSYHKIRLNYCMDNHST